MGSGGYKMGGGGGREQVKFYPNRRGGGGTLAILKGAHTKVSIL